MVFASMSIILASVAPSWSDLGAEMLAKLKAECFSAHTELYTERPDRKQPAFNWGVGVMLSALNAAAKHDPTRYQEDLRAYANASRKYWNGIGYDVLPVPKPRDLYYDDNAWMALALVETYDILGDKKYLDWARDALTFALSGESENGGIYWRMSDKASRNTCSSGPTAAACLAVAKRTGDDKLKATAERLYEWTLHTLQDPSDHLFFDSISNDGKIEKTKWSYNAALMIRAGRELGKASWHAIAQSARLRWIKQDGIHDPGRFAHLLAENLLETQKAPFEIETAMRAVATRRSKSGWVAGHWGRAANDDNPEILDQAAYARMCFILAEFKRSTR